MHANPSTKATILIFNLFPNVSAQVFVTLCCTAASSKEEKPKAEEGPLWQCLGKYLQPQGTDDKQIFVGVIVSQEEALTRQKEHCELIWK